MVHFGDNFMGQLTQPTVWQHWRTTVSQPHHGPPGWRYWRSVRITEDIRN